MNDFLKICLFYTKAHLNKNCYSETKRTVGFYDILFYISHSIRKCSYLLQGVAMEIPDVHGKELEEVKYTGN